MSFLGNPIVMCSVIAAGIIFILVMVVVFCCKRCSDKEREELKAISEEIESDTLEESISEYDDAKIESVLSKMQEALEEKQEKSISFEEEQEENAIISYQELLSSLGATSSIDVDSIEVYDDELDNRVEISDINKEIIDAYQREDLSMEMYRFQNDYSSQEMPMEFETPEAPVMDLTDVDTDVLLEETYQAKTEEPHKFKSSEFISPVYGVINNVAEKVVDNVEEEIVEISFDEDSF